MNVDAAPDAASRKTRTRPTPCGNNWEYFVITYDNSSYNVMLSATNGSWLITSRYRASDDLADGADGADASIDRADGADRADASVDGADGADGAEASVDRADGADAFVDGAAASVDRADGADASVSGADGRGRRVRRRG